MIEARTAYESLIVQLGHGMWRRAAVAYQMLAAGVCMQVSRPSAVYRMFDAAQCMQWLVEHAPTGSRRISWFAKLSKGTPPPFSTYLSPLSDADARLVYAQLALWAPSLA